jgi:hypothetical protein
MRWWRKGEKSGDNFDKVNDVKNNNLFSYRSTFLKKKKKKCNFVRVIPCINKK